MLDNLSIDQAEAQIKLLVNSFWHYVNYANLSKDQIQEDTMIFLDVLTAVSVKGFENIKKTLNSSSSCQGSC